LGKIEIILEEFEDYDFKQKKVSFFSIFKKMKGKEVLKGAYIMPNVVKILSKHYTK